MRVPVLLLVAVLVSPFALAAPQPATLLPQEGPDVPPASAPVATLVAFDNETWSYDEGVRTHAVLVPDVAWNRVVLTFQDNPGTDPWDRLFGVGLGGVEVLHGTTPRAPMTLTKDVTSYAALLAPGARVNVTLHFGTWVGYQKLSVVLRFYDDATAPLVEGAHDATLGAFEFRGLCCGGSVVQTTVPFPDAAPTRAIVELTTSGHGQDGEFWWMDARAPPVFHVWVGGVEIARATAMPYTYALLGFSPQNTVDTAVHGAMWWTAQQGLDAAGVHPGVGEIPPYRAELPADALPLLVGAQDVRVTMDWSGPGGSWPTSLTFQLDA